MPRLISIEELEERFTLYYTLASQYVDQTNAAYQTQLFVNPACLYVAVKSAYDDIERYKIYHQDDPANQKANAVKRVAYLTKWIARARPIHYQPGSDFRDIVPYICNAGFALYLSQSLIAAELGVAFSITLEKEYELIYDLTYREVSGDALLAIFQMIYDAVQGVPLLENLTPHRFEELP